MDRRTFLTGVGCAALVGCAAPKPLGTYETTEVSAPAWKPGTTWTFKRTDRFTKLPRGTLTRGVAAAENGRLRLVTSNERQVIIDDAIFTEPGIQISGTLSEEGPMIGGYDPFYRRYDFPLVSGKRWDDRFYINRTDNQGNQNFVQIWTQVEGWENIDVAGQSYRAIVLRRGGNLGPRSFWNGTLYRDEIEWYVPKLGAAGRWVTSEEYYYGPTYRLSDLVKGDHFLYVLESFNLS